MKKLLVVVLVALYWSIAYGDGEDRIVTTTGDVTAGVSRHHNRALYTNAGITWLLLGIDSTASTSHKLFFWKSTDDGNNWSEEARLNSAGGYVSSQLDPAMAWFKEDTVWAIPPTTYSGSNMQLRRLASVSVGSLDTINPATNTMVTPPMRWTGDTLIYMLDDQLNGEMVVVKSGGVWSQSVTWTPIDTSATVEYSDVNYDYCGSGVAVWDRTGRDMYWFDGTVNDAFKTLGTDKIPALLSSTAKNATTMAVYRDSMIVVIGYLARDTCLWEYRWWATGGSRKTGMTLIDSTKLLPKNYFAGNATDSMSPMPCLSGTTDGDTATLHVRYWKNPSNADSMVIGRSTAAKFAGTETSPYFGTAMFDSVNLTRNQTSYGEGKRYMNMCVPRYIYENAMVFWQKGISSPDTIYASIDNKLTFVIEGLSQVNNALGSDWVYFGGANNNEVHPDSGILEDTYMSGAATSTNYATSDSLQLTLSGTQTTTRATLVRPLLFRKVPLPARVVWAEFAMKCITNPDSLASNVTIRWFGCFHPARIGEVTNVNYRTSPSTNAWNSSQARGTSGANGPVFGVGTTYPDISLVYMNTATGNTLNIGVGGVLTASLNGNQNFWVKLLNKATIDDSIGWIKIGKQTAGSNGTTSFWSTNTATTGDRPVMRMLFVYAEHRFRTSYYLRPNARARLLSKATLYTPL